MLSLTSFEVGPFASMTLMTLMTFVFFRAPTTRIPARRWYWFPMQVGMIIRFFTAWPTKVWLTRRGIKEAM